MKSSITRTVLDTVDVVSALVGSDAVAQGWSEESACAGMSTGGLAHHLAQQPRALVRLLPTAPFDGQPIRLLDHYLQAPWSNGDEEANREIREGADRAAEDGPDAVRARLAADVEALPDVLDAVADDVPVLIPWQGWALTAHDLVVTRLMEMVVHSDDLAASIDQPTPEFPDEAVRLVLDLLSQVAVARHGQAAVVRALSRPQRAPESVSAF